MHFSFARTTHGGLVLSVLIALSGCALHRARVAHKAERQLIGLSEEDLLQCAGAPAQEKRAGSLSFLTYHGGGDAVAVAQPFGQSQIGIATIKHRYCDATFTLRNGRVAELHYRGRTGGLLTRDEQCAFVVDGCVAR
ncbi:MAG: hypothetical protein JWN04_964 [Myxococcaceae bacterium]|nr:hypothetical protein [Myxococcaceae bacterium]